MVKNLVLGIAVITLTSACIKSETASDTSVSKNADLACAQGKYNFRTDSDNKKHFDATFDGKGGIAYNLKDGPSGTYTVNGRAISIVGPFGPNRTNQTWNWTLDGCVANKMVGTSLSGTKLTASK